MPCLEHCDSTKYLLTTGTKYTQSRCTRWCLFVYFCLLFYIYFVLTLSCQRTVCIKGTGLFVSRSRERHTNSFWQTLITHEADFSVSDVVRSIKCHKVQNPQIFHLQCKKPKWKRLPYISCILFVHITAQYSRALREKSWKYSLSYYLLIRFTHLDLLINQIKLSCRKLVISHPVFPVWGHFEVIPS